MLGTLREKEKNRWREYVKPLTHAYNCTKYEVTGYSPYELMFGQQPRLPIDIAFGLPVKEASSTTHSQYVKNLKFYLREGYKIAMENARKVADNNKTRFDMKVRESCLEIGDRVLVRNLRLRNKHKLIDRWEPTVYVVQKRAGDLPVYTVCPVGQDGPMRTLHRDLLLPCGFLADENEEPEQPLRVSRPRTRQNSPQSDENPVDSDEEDYSLSYPLRFEMETRILEPSIVYPTENATQNGNGPSS